MANAVPVGSGNAQHEYYLSVHVQPPTFVFGDGRVQAAAAMDQMLLGALTCAESWAQRERYPVALGDASASKLLPALSKGKLFALVWAPSGSGDTRFTYGESANKDAITLDALCEQISKLPPRQRPPLLFVVTPFCAVPRV